MTLICVCHCDSHNSSIQWNSINSKQLSILQFFIDGKPHIVVKIMKHCIYAWGESNCLLSLLWVCNMDERVQKSITRLFGFDLIFSLHQIRYLRFAQLLGSGKAKRLCASAMVAPIVSSVNVRSTDILRGKRKKIKRNFNSCCLFRLSSTTNWAAADRFRFWLCRCCAAMHQKRTKNHQSINTHLFPDMNRLSAVFITKTVRVHRDIVCSFERDNKLSNHNEWAQSKVLLNLVFNVLWIGIV